MRQIQQATVAVQTGDLDGVVIEHDRREFICSITGAFFFDPVMTDCGQHIERSASAKLKKCPCCNKPDIQFNEASSFLKTALQKMIQAHSLYEDVYFDLERFKKIVAMNELNTPLGERFLTLLQNAPLHLNTKELIRTETQLTNPVYQIPEVTVVETQGKSPIEILAETDLGRDVLRRKLKIVSSAEALGSKQYFFGDAEISAESLQTQINGKSIREWLSMTTAMEKFEKGALEIMAAIENEDRIIGTYKKKITNQFALFLSSDAQGGYRTYSEAINPALQHVAYGEESKVRDVLELVKNDPEKLTDQLFDTGTVKDYSDRTITGMTLLQAAVAAGDVDMCLMLKNYMLPEEFATQFSEIFPRGIEAHEREQQSNAFNFDAILAAIRDATPADLDAALKEEKLTESDSARAKPNSALSLTEALNRFREQFTKLSHDEKIFNPQHLLRALETYTALLKAYAHDVSDDKEYKKPNLFWRQIIGYIQRFMPACYAQAFAQGLCAFVKVDGDAQCQSAPFKRTLTFKQDPTFSYFSKPFECNSGLGFTFALDFRYAWGRLGGYQKPASWEDFLKIFLAQKYQAFRELCPKFQCSRATSLNSVSS